MPKHELLVISGRRARARALLTRTSSFVIVIDVCPLKIWASHVSAAPQTNTWRTNFAFGFLVFSFLFSGVKLTTAVLRCIIDCIR